MLMNQKNMKKQKSNTKIRKQLIEGYSAIDKAIMIEFNEWNLRI